MKKFLTHDLTIPVVLFICFACSTYRLGLGWWTIPGWMVWTLLMYDTLRGMRRRSRTSD